MVESMMEVVSIPGGVNSAFRRFSPQLNFRSAVGSTLVSTEGKEYVDYHCASGPIVLGHNFEAVQQRVREATRGVDLLGLGASEAEFALARKVCSLVPSAQRVQFCNSGSEATYHAIRLSRAVTGRKKLVKFQGCYHGWHDAVLVSGDTLVCTYNSLDSVEAAILQKPEQIAAIIVEPIAHNAGCILPQDGFLEGLRAITQREGILLIFDEVITGFRHSLGGYQKICGVAPDLTTMGKAMANGYPIGAVCGRADLLDRFSTHPSGDVMFAGTYNGHPLVCAAALATIDVLEQPDSYNRLYSLGQRMRDGLTEIVRRTGIEATVTGYGSIFVVYFMSGAIKSYEDLARNDAEAFVRFRRALIAQGIFQMPANLKRCHVCLSHTEADIDRTLEASGHALG